MKKINIVIPFYNEGKKIPEFLDSLIDNIEVETYDFTISIIDDGSNDSSWEEIAKFSNTKCELRKIKLSRNFGHQGAIFAGLSQFKEDAVIIMDGDFQDDPKYINQFIKHWLNGSKIVLANRVKRKENLIRRFFVYIYYALQYKISDIKIPKNVGHYSLIDKKVVSIITQLKESKKFLLGLRAFTGFKTTYVDVVRNKRIHGSSKMNLKKLIKLSSEGLIGFSTAPINFIGALGLILSFLLIIISLYLLVNKVVGINRVISLDIEILFLFFISSFQLLSLSIIGLYVAKIFDEAKDRPQFIIEEIISN